MRIRLRFFAFLRERAGQGGDRDVAPGTTVGALWAAIRREHPAIGSVQVRFAVNETYVSATHQLEDGDEVAFFPPVSGGR